jgi:hypothetical protein
MSDFKLPELPSDEELGITEEDLEDLPEEEPELSAEEMAALLGERAGPSPSPADGGKAPKKAKEKRKKKSKQARPPAGEKKTEGTKDGLDTPADPTPRSRWRGPLTLASLVVLAFLTSSSRTLPRPVAANAPDTEFSSARAMSHLVEIARQAHPPGSPEHARVRTYIMERLRDLGLEPEVQTATATIRRGTVARAATVRNVVARIPGSASTGAIVLTAHYDGREGSTAAGDDGMGVVAILETVRALRSGPPLGNDLIVLITDAEELGLLGARAFVDGHPWMADVSVVLSVEMRGGGGPSVMFETGDQNGWIVRTLREGDPRPFANSLSYEVYRRMPNDTDFSPFREAGRQGLNFAGIGRASVYHQTYDTPANVSEATLQHHGLHLLGVVRELSDRNLTEVVAPDVTFFSLPVLGLVVYEMDFVPLVTAAAVLLTLLLLLPLRATGGQWSGTLIGLGLGIASLGLAGMVGWALMTWLPQFHPEYGSLHGGAFHSEGWYVLALTSATLAIVTTLFGIARRWRGGPELVWGALLLPLGGAIVLTLSVPAAAMNLQWPLLAALLGTLALMLPAGPRTAHLAWGLLVLTAVPVLAFLVPVTEFLWLGLSFRQAMVLGAVLATQLLLLLPALDRLREPNSWWAPVVGVVATAAFVALGIGIAEPDSRRPAPSTLVYAYDQGAMEALWVTDASADPIDEEARAWAEARAGSPFSESRRLAAFGLGSGEFLVAPATSIESETPQLWILSDSTNGGVRRLRLAVRSAVGAELLQFRFPQDGSTTPTAVNGHALAVEGRPTVVEHWGEPDPVVTLELEVVSGNAPEMDVVEHLLRPEELLGPDAFQRPSTLAPDIVSLSDRAVLRTPFEALSLIPGEPRLRLGTEGEDARDAADGNPDPGDGAGVVRVDTLATTDTTERIDSLPMDDTVPSPDTSGVPDTTETRRR